MEVGWIVVGVFFAVLIVSALVTVPKTEEEQEAENEAQEKFLSDWRRTHENR